VVRIVECVEQIAVERVDICETGEGLDCGGESLAEGLGGVLDFSRVEGSDTADLEAGTDLLKMSALIQIGRHTKYIRT